MLIWAEASKSEKIAKREEKRKRESSGSAGKSIQKCENREKGGKKEARMR